MLKIKLLLLFFLFFTIAYSQTTIKGKILDENKKPLIGANVLAFPSDKSKLVFFASDNLGNYSLLLKKNTAYNLSISFMGFITKKDVLTTPQKDSIINFILKEDPNKLEEIVINYKIPIKIRKDTTTYIVDAFTNGKERKLKNVLKKLPGVEVDRKGNVTVKGKKVTTLLVDNKKFFTGDTKLAVNNIPADVIDKIDVIEDYYENPFMKGLEKSNEIAMNINLKEDKKKFAFGDIESGLGVKNRYVLHPAIFKYSPKTNYSFIGDINNTNRKSFTLRDYINFEGGFDLNNAREVLESPVIKLLRNQNYINNKHKFGGGNIQHTKNEKLSFSSFLIALSDNSNSKTESFRNYLADNSIEKLNEDGTNNQFLVLGKLQLIYTPNKDTRIKYYTKFETTSVNQTIENSRNLDNIFINFNEKNQVDAKKIKSYFKVEKKFSSKHTSQAIVDFNFNKINDNNNWFTNTNIFPKNIPIDENRELNIFQNSSSEKFEYNVAFKHFWILNNVNHLYFNIGNNYEQNTFVNNLFQGNNQFNDFKNNLNHNQFTLFTSILYKKLVGDVILTAELKYQNYYRTTTDVGISNSYNSNLLLPKIEMDWDITSKKKLTFKYSLTNTFPNTRQLIYNRVLNNYNNIFLGNSNLEETFYHFISLRYRNYKTYGWSFYPSIYYKIRNNQIQSIFSSSSIFNVIAPTNIGTPNNSLTTNFKIAYNYKYWRAILLGEYRNANYTSIFNDTEIKSIDNSFLTKVTFKTVYEDKPNIDFSYSQTYNDNSNALFSTISNLSNLDVVADYEIGNWTFKTEYLYNFYKNNATNNKNSFNEINASIFYQKENSAWKFEIIGNNIDNNTSKINSNLSSFLFYETRRYVFPRTFVFKVIYKL